jgi:hypothetical protein
MNENREKNREKGFIKYIVIITIILVIVFLSQQAGFRQYSQYGKDLTARASSWARDNVWPRISGEVEKRGELIKDEVGQKIKNYFSGIVDNIFKLKRSK